MARRKRPYDYDLIVIGSGAGGGVAAHILARQGKKVAIVEEERIGGECPNWGCVPTKALLRSSEMYHTAKESKKFGIRAATIGYNYHAVKNWVDIAVYRTGTTEGLKAYENEGIHLIRGRAYFLSQHKISVSDKHYSAKKFLIATGTRNFIPPIPGLTESGFLTHRSVFGLTQPPKSLFIIGGGPIGCEFAQAFSDFESGVIIAEVGDRLIARENPEAGDLVGKLFKERDIAVLTNTKVIKVESDRAKKIVYFEQNGKIHSARVDNILLSAGMLPNTDLALENAKVAYNQHGIIVDETMRTTTRNIYAAGDVVGPFQFTHMATYQSRVVAHNLYNRRKLAIDYHAVPRCVFVSPELASVGYTDAQAKAFKIKFDTASVSIDIIGRANTSDIHEGFVKVSARKKDGVIIGATIVAPRAGEMIHELTLAVNKGLTVADVANTIHAFPTWSEAVRIACHKLVK